MQTTRFNRTPEEHRALDVMDAETVSETGIAESTDRVRTLRHALVIEGVAATGCADYALQAADHQHIVEQMGRDLTSAESDIATGRAE